MISVLKNSLILFLLFLYGCGQDPQPIEYGKDSCEYCMMLITDSKYGAELVTPKGKCFKFDSVECMVEHLLEDKSDQMENAALWINDFTKPAHFINAKSAYYLQNEKFHSPMGFNVLAVEDHKEFNKIKEEHGGVEYNWDKIVELVRSM